MKHLVISPQEGAVNEFLIGNVNFAPVSKAKKAKEALNKHGWFSVCYLSSELSELTPRSRCELESFLQRFDGLDFCAMTEDGRKAVWDGVRLYYGFTEEQFPYPKKFIAIDRLELIKFIAIDRLELMVSPLGIKLTSDRISLSVTILCATIFIVSLIAWS